MIFGWFCIRLSGIYLAMLTLAFAQILWSVAQQWVQVTGGDNGLLGLYRSPMFASNTAYYYLVLSLCVIAILVMRHLYSRRSDTHCGLAEIPACAPRRLGSMSSCTDGSRSSYPALSEGWQGDCRRFRREACFLTASVFRSRSTR